MIHRILRLGGATLLAAAAAIAAVGTAAPAAADVPIDQRAYVVHVESVRSFDETGPGPNLFGSDEIWVASGRPSAAGRRARCRPA